MKRTPKEQAALDGCMEAFDGDGVIVVVLRDPKDGVLDTMSVHSRAREDSYSMVIHEALARRIAQLIKEAWEAAGVEVQLKDR